MKLQQIIETIIQDDEVHARFLNTLSLMENKGQENLNS